MAVAEVGTVPSVNYLDTWFQRRPRDERFSEVSYTQFNSIVSLEAGTQLIFSLNATDPPVCYDISDCLLSATVRITKEDGSLPNKEALVYPVNLSLLSCFESLDLRVNDVSITQNPGYYGYRSYFQSLISHSESAKQTNLFLSGWLTDNYSLEDGIGDIEPTSTNEGMLGRNAWFRENLQQGTDHPYSVGGYQMVCPVKHELYGSRVLFPPSTKITFTFTKASSAWYLMVPPPDPPATEDKERYKFHLSNCVLFVKVCTLNDHIYKSLVTRMEKEPIIMHYRRLAVKSEVLHSHSIFFESNNLFPDTSSPLRVYFALVKNKSLGDSYQNNPYNFLRSLKVKPLTGYSGSNPSFVSQETLQYKQLEILLKQQAENQKIFEELHRLTAREQKRKRKAKERRLQAKKTITQTDGNDSEDCNAKTSNSNKGKTIPGKNVTKRSVRNKPKSDGQIEEQVQETGQSTESDLVTPPNHSADNAKLKSKQSKEKRHLKNAHKLLAYSSEDDLDTSDNDYDYSDSFINDESETSDTDSEYDTAQSKVQPKQSQTIINQPSKSSSKRSKPKVSRHTRLNTPPPPPLHYQNIQGTDEDICFVESFTLDVNSKPLDQFYVPATKVSCVSDYVRFLATTGFFQSIHSADLTYEMFKCGFGIFAFDLSVSKTTTDPYAVPLATGGYLRVRIKFNRPPQTPLMLLILSETSETLTIDREGRIQLSYKNPVVKN